MTYIYISYLCALVLKEKKKRKEKKNLNPQ